MSQVHRHGKLGKGSGRDQDGRTSYQASFGGAMIVLRYAIEPSGMRALDVFVGCYLPLFWPYMIVHRVANLGLPFWWTTPIFLVTAAVALAPFGLIVKLLCLVVLHAPLLFMRAGRFSHRKEAGQAGR